MNPFVTVVIPTYNSAHTVTRAISSVLMQTYVNYEIVVVDDCSSDNTMEVLKSAESEIKLVSFDKNMGAAAARNAGMKVAKGDLIAFLDADDVWHPQKLEIQVCAFDANPDIFLISSTRGEYVSSFDHVSDWFFKNISPIDLLFTNHIFTSSVVIRNTKNYYFCESMRYAEDHNLWLKIAFDAKRVILINKNLAFQFKPSFGFSGLSAKIASMHHGEITNLIELYGLRKINIFIYIILGFWIKIKYFRRIIIKNVRDYNINK